MVLEIYLQRFHKSLAYRIFAFVIDTLLLPIGFFSNRNIKNVKNILVIRKDEIGDMILSLPFFKAIKKAYPKSKLIVLSGRPSTPMLKNNPYIDEIIEIETARNSKFKFFSEAISQISEIRKRKIDIGFDPKGSLLSIIMMYLAGVKARVSYWNVSGGKALLTHPVTYDKQIHESETGIKLLRAIGKYSKNSLPSINIDKDESKEGIKIVESLPKNYTCIYMTPSLPYKSWPEERWSELFLKLKEENFVILCRDVEIDALKKFEEGNKNVKIIAVKSLRLLSVVMREAKAIIAVDGGPMHLAWISNPKTIALFGQNDVKLWKNLRGITLGHFPESMQGVNRVLADLSKANNKYMKMITVKEVIENLKR